MAENTNIKIKDAQNWVNDNSQIINWSSYHQTFKAERTQQQYLPPIVYSDTWNGVSRDVQHVRFDSWRLEFTGRESEIHDLSRMQSCDSVIIDDIGNGLTHTVNTQLSEWLSFAEPERQSKTANWRLVIIYRTNKTIINKFTPLANQVTVLINSVNYYSKYEKLNLPNESTSISPLWTDGSNKLLQETNKTGVKCLFYMNNADLETFRTAYNSYTVTVDSVALIEKLPLEVNQLGEDNYQIILSGITTSTPKNVDLTPLNTHTLIVTDASGVYTFYTDYSTEANVDDTEKDVFDNDDGLPADSKTISRQVTDIKLFLNTADKNSLKLHYERGTTAVIDAVPILYRGIVEVNKLGDDLWEANIKGLTTTPTITYPL